MIQYALKCADGHSFDSWFQSSEAYEKLVASGMIACAVCGICKVEKAVMAPRVRAASDAAIDATPPAPGTPLTQPANAKQQALAELRRRVEDNSDYVGVNFADEARAMHEGKVPERAIYGEAKVDEARKLLDEGISVAPLPFLPNRKTN
ncbi:DUF1178 family protein [Sedimentitalea sp. HM32M-2]|uniref:DUF1178 family protein n=1 Tax=Sedimentitalea sp. HM32M-2 TaxID=3351566 RepID=UPI0036365502